MPAYNPPASGLTIPAWMWQGTTGDCASGAFVTDAADSLSTTKVRISGTNQAGSDSSWIANISNSATIVVFRDQAGRTAAFTIMATDAIDDGDGNPTGCFEMDLATPVGELTWNGLYTFAFYPTL